MLGKSNNPMENLSLIIEEEEDEIHSTTKIPFLPLVFPTNVGLISFILFHLCVLFICIYLIVITSDPFGLISSHILAMIGWILTSFLAISLLQQVQPLALKRIFPWHWILNRMAMFFLFIGLVCILISKIVRKREHFKSAHGITGLITIILAFVMSTLTFVIKFMPDMVGGIKKARKFYPLHRFIGYILALLTLLCIYFSLDSGTVSKNLTPVWKTTITVSLVVVGMLMFMRLNVNKLF